MTPTARVKADYMAEITSYLYDKIDPVEKEDYKRVNIAAGGIYRMLRHAVKMMDAKQPGRTQKGNLDAAMRAIMSDVVGQLRAKS